MADERDFDKSRYPTTLDMWEMVMRIKIGYDKQGEKYMIMLVNEFVVFLTDWKLELKLKKWNEPLEEGDEQALCNVKLIYARQFFRGFAASLPNKLRAIVGNIPRYKWLKGLELDFEDTYPFDIREEELLSLNPKYAYEEKPIDMARKRRSVYY